MSEGPKFRLFARDGRVCLRFADGDKDIPVRVALVRPLTDPDGMVSYLDDDKKEVALTARLADLDPESAALARAELDARYLMPRIVRVLRTTAKFGVRYWEVETDRGPRTFAMRDPHKNVTWRDDDRFIIRDTMGNMYEVRSLAGLDARSREQAERVI